MPRQARLDAPGILQHVIVKGFEGRQVFAEVRDRKDFITRMGDLALEQETKVYVWALMRNHVHILLRTGPKGLAKYMRRLLTGYAITYNRRHSRRGYLFQDRYKSIVCDEDHYFKELVRYIHLNPLRAKIVKDLSELDRYPWCGHRVLLGNVKHSWQDTSYVLSWFGKRQGSALRAYRQYLLGGVSQGRRSELVGGAGGQSGKEGDKSDRGSRDREAGVDQRILGDGDFITKVKKEFFSHERERRFDFREIKKKIQSIVEVSCREGEVQTQELQMGSRRGQVTEVRAKIARKLVNELGISLREVAYHVGVSSSAISKMLQRRSL
jgi:putative transposase